ncbi:hypothetical protein Caci_5786 [Catenulispora acidiphila DSM 44928]|uniref:Uncharacterized protein n=1 Tax=Catenulispora acidiphila (strain DSM 44928 / JCM 14897 / NBRC 102108 / NRRL B-24433 / ID139908) TaxID=479433 RepID=C7QDM0_CATAD|nr:hypothetical protein [Catenulispora acidiphila]ACU74644.1 hypothetical protein Caci_5786 [Catenulispora acidiphila DSM 44928]
MPEDLTEDERLNTFIAELIADPRRAKVVAARWAKTVGTNDSVAFLEEACRMLAADKDFDAAAVCFSHVCDLDPAADDDGLHRLHTRFLDFAPQEAIAPKDYRAYAKTLTEKTDPATAHARFREVVCAALDVGFVPYAAVFPDLRALARAAGIKRAVEEAFLADRMLRGGALAGASLKVWQAAVPALERLAVGDEELLRLLVASQPRDGSEDPQVAEQIRRLWLGLLAEVGAGRVLTAEWFAGPGARCPMDVLFALVEQADLPGWRPDNGSVPDDDAQFAAAREFAPGDPADERYTSPGWVSQHSKVQEFAARIQDGATDRTVRTACVEELSGFVARIGYFANVDYRKELAQLWNAGDPVRGFLRQLVDTWIADAASTGLHAVDVALNRLSRLADAGYQNLDPGFGAALPITDPAVALTMTLRAGLPAELTLPGPLGESGDSLPSMLRVALDGERLAVFTGLIVHVMQPGQENIRFRAPTLPNDASVVLWHDGVSARLARRVHSAEGERRFSFSIDPTDRDPRITLDQAPTWPQAPSEAQIVFPGSSGASEATRVSSADGFAYVYGPDGAVTVRIPFGGLQRQKRAPRLVAPPAWWEHLDAVDATGSAALRAVDEAQAQRLLIAGFQGPQTVADAVSEVLPDVTDPRLGAAVAEAAVTAARCTTNAAQLRQRLGLAQPESLPELLRCRPELPFYRDSAAVVGGRLLDALVQDVLAQEPEPDGSMRLVRTVEVPTGAASFWYVGHLLGGSALRTTWSWLSAHDRDRELERLQAMVNTPQSDGSRRWRYRTLKRDRNWSADVRGQLWRTPTSVLAVLSHTPRDTVSMAEYAPDGVFDPRVPDGWPDVTEHVRMPVWGGPDQVTALTRLLAQKDRGPVAFDAGQAILLADKTGIGVPDAAVACFGAENADQPRKIRALYGARVVGYRELDDLRERLMPGDPADLWTTGLAVEEAARWWNSHTHSDR